MTASVRVVNTSNWDEDVIVMCGSHVETLKRGEVTKALGCASNIETKIGVGRGKVHERGYKGEVVVTTNPPMPVGSFGWALELVKKGYRIQRRGWNGKGMFVYLYTPDGNLEPYLMMHNAQGREQPGWLASQPDMLCDDWEEYDETTEVGADA